MKSSSWTSLLLVIGSPIAGMALITNLGQNRVETVYSGQLSFILSVKSE